MQASAAKLNHEGRHPRRLASNPAEQVFAEEWRKQQETGHTLEWLLCVSMDQQRQERDVTQEEATCAATLMQWLGSPVGSSWLEDALAKAKRANEGERK